MAPSGGWLPRPWDETESGAFQELQEGPVWLSHREHSCPKQGPGREFILPDCMPSDQKVCSFSRLGSCLLGWIPGASPESPQSAQDSTALARPGSPCCRDLTSPHPPNSPPGSIFSSSYFVDESRATEPLTCPKVTQISSDMSGFEPSPQAPSHLAQQQLWTSGLS